jgi:hypothetical protein
LISGSPPSRGASLCFTRTNMMGRVAMMVHCLDVSCMFRQDKYRQAQSAYLVIHDM